MRYLVFEGRVSADNDSIIAILAALHENTENIDVAMNSGGGELPISAWLLEIFNDHKSHLQLSVIGEVSSAAFTLWAGFKGYKRVCPGSWSYVHMSSRTGFIRDAKLSQDAKILLKDGIHLKEFLEPIVFPELTAAEKKSYMTENDVLLSYARLKAIAAKHNKANNVNRLQ